MVPSSTETGDSTMNVQELRNKLKQSSFWSEDAYGHFKSPTGKSRIKIQKISIRVEHKLSDGRWFSKVNDYVKNLQFGTGSQGQEVLIVNNRKINL
jgi:ethanolamine utilization protein EutQ (cupin superfamily)